MPIYEYTCSDCGTKFELLRSFSQADKSASCPRCHNGAKRKMSTFASFTKTEGGMPMPIGGSGCSCGACSGSSCSTCGH